MAKLTRRDSVYFSGHVMHFIFPRGICTRGTTFERVAASECSVAVGNALDAVVGCQHFGMPVSHAAT